MSDNTTSCNKGRVALLASVAVNIFLVAFTLGRVGFHDAPPVQQGMFPPGMHHPMPPQDFAEREHGPMQGPRFFGPADLFAPGEAKEDEARMRENFDKMDALRTDFAKQLQDGPVSRDAVLKHFGDIEQVMDGVKKDMQNRAADKISTMSDDDRARLSKALLERRDDPRMDHEGQRGPQDLRHDAPSGDEPQRAPDRDSIKR